MSSALASQSMLELAGELLALAEAQRGALNGGDLAAFGQLADRRDALLPRLAARPDGANRETLRALLGRVALLDEQNIALVRGLLAELNGERGELQRGQGALRGYRRPTITEPAPGVLFDFAG